MSCIEHELERSGFCGCQINAAYFGCDRAEVGLRGLPGALDTPAFLNLLGELSVHTQHVLEHQALLLRVELWHRAGPTAAVACAGGSGSTVRGWRGSGVAWGKSLFGKLVLLECRNFSNQ